MVKNSIFISLKFCLLIGNTCIVIFNNLNSLKSYNFKSFFNYTIGYVDIDNLYKNVFFALQNTFYYFIIKFIDGNSYYETECISLRWQKDLNI